MSDWQAYLSNIAVISEENQTLRFTETAADYPQLFPQGTVTPLIHQGLIAVEGEDACRFLQGQLTCDVTLLAANDSQLGACCNPKGRMLTNFILYRTEEQRYLMQMHHSLVAPTLQHLQKYAVFFKAKMTDVSNQYVILGLSEAASYLSGSSKSYATKGLDDGRSIIIVNEDSAQETWQQMTAEITPVGTEYWQLLDIRAGIGFVQAETADMFIPQMLNLQALDGISFRKGCYTGQEVVARMKYLGKLKRHMYRRVTSETSEKALTPGTACYLPDGEQSIGNLVTTAHNGRDLEMLVVLTDAGAGSKQLLVGEKSFSVSPENLPYSI
ncbi:MAG: folate-binding protein [Gammaproteobacteria bacterium]|nr:MAG: folate-binding protein [Gammaproteobacteria bacterium]